MISLLLFITALVICIVAVVLLVFDSMKTQKYLEIQQQSDKYNLHLTETNDGKIVEKNNNKNNSNSNNNEKNDNNTKVNMDDYVLKSKLKPDVKCPNMTDYIKKTQIPSCKTCPDMDDYVKKTEVPSCPEPTDMSNYIHKNDINKYAKLSSAPLFDYKSMWHDAADMFNKHFKSHFDKMMDKKDELVVAIKETAKKHAANLKAKQKSKTNTKKIENNTNNKENEPVVKQPPTINTASYDMTRSNNEVRHVFPSSHYEKTTYGPPISDDKLRPANSLMCNGFSHKTTDSCYYY